MHRVETSLKQDIFTLSVELRAEMRASAAQLRSDFKGDLAQLEIKIAKTESKMIRWMFIFWIGQVAAMKFLR